MGANLTYAGAVLAISTTAAPDDLDQTGFEALTFTDIGKTGTIGEWITTDNIIQYNTTDDDVANKQKGIADAGDPVVECAFISDDAGQLAMVAARATSNIYAFELTLSDGTILYSRGLVGGAGIGGGGGREDFVIRRFTLGLVQIPLEAT